MKEEKEAAAKREEEERQRKEVSGSSSCNGSSQLQPMEGRGGRRKGMHITMYIYLDVPNMLWIPCMGNTPCCGYHVWAIHPAVGTMYG